MKSITSRLSGIAPVIMFPLYIIFRKNKKTGMALLLFITICLSSCFLHFYKTNTDHTVDAATIQKLQAGNKYFILHAGDAVFTIKNLKATNDILEGDLEKLPKEQLKYIHADSEKENRFPIRDRSIVLYAVHLYTQDHADNNSHISLPLKNFNRIDVYELDKGATNTSRIFSIIGLTLGTAVFIVAIVAVASCNCPQVYTCNGAECKFNGGLYSGAIYASLERKDYMPLQTIYPQDNKLCFRINGVEGEEEIINEMKLIKIAHEKEETALMDRNGNILLYRQPIAPERASIGEKNDITKEVSTSDAVYYSFTNRSDNQTSSDIILDFKKPAGASAGKLILRAKNSGWSGYLFHEFNSYFGNYYAEWAQKKDKADPKEMQQWQIDQSLPLLVSVKDGNNWKYIDYFVPPGNTAERDMIMKINLTGAENTDHLQIRLQTAYMFWDLDYAGMDFTEHHTYTMAELPATKIVKSDSSSQKEQLSEKDKNYTHLINKEYIVAEFEDSPLAPGQGTSYFLMSSGYYHVNKNYPGKPAIAKLKTFLEKGAFDKFSRQKFEALQNSMANNSGGTVPVK
jgi:hypothetical protein